MYSTTGYGRVSREFLISLSKLTRNLHVIPYGPDQSQFLDKDERGVIRALERPTTLNDAVVILHAPPSLWPTLKVKGADAVIGMTITEADGFPPFWVELCNRTTLDEVWVPTEFSRAGLVRSGVHPEKLRTIHYGIRAGPVAPGPPEPARPFRFLYIADLTPRKNVEALVEAFAREYAGRRDVELVVHLTLSSSAEEARLARIRQTVIEVNNIRLSTEKLSEADTRNLLRSCDVYVSVDLASGWGMPQFEAMSLGIPSVTVDWGGSKEFMNASNSFLIRPRAIRPVDAASAAYYVHYTGLNWAVVDAENIREQLRSSFQDAERRRSTGVAAAQDIRSRFDVLTVSAGILRLAEEFPRRANRGRQPTIVPRSGIYLQLLSLYILVRASADYLAAYKRIRPLIRRGLGLVIARFSR